MKQVAIILATLFVLTSVQSIAQPLRTVPYDMQIEVANEQMAINNYPGALEYYSDAYKTSRDKNLAVKIAQINYILRDYDRAEGYYKRLLLVDSDSLFTEHRYEWAKTLQHLGRFKEAAEQYAIFRDYSSDEVKRADALRELKGMQAANGLEDNVETVIRFAGEVNSPSAENGARLYSDGTMYYGAIKARKAIETEGNNQEQFSKIYTSTRGEKGWEKGEALGEHVNREGFHTANPSFSGDGRTMYYTRSLLLGNEVEFSQIYKSTSTDDGWSPAIEIPSLAGDYIATHPVPGELFGNDVLFFTSDMDGGFGGMDLYYAEMRGDEFGVPVNLGEGINTAGDDITPFYLNGTLYFSSDGRPGLGGMDAFKSEWDGNQWSTPMNMGYQYNTTYDDINLSFDVTGESGFIISNRPDEKKKKLKSKTCCDDIYEFSVKQLVIDLFASLEDANGPIVGGQVQLINETLGGAPDARTNTLSNEFRYLLDSDNSYKAIATMEGYYPDTITFNTNGIFDNYTVRKTITLLPIPPAEKEPEFEEVTINEPIRLNNIYYDLDKWDILPAAEQDLRYIEELMDQYSDMVIELSSHTDSRGKTRYNLDLSQKRAKSAKDWLVNRGIDPNRIKPVGYGESKILNQCVGRVKCTEEEHRINRRTEFKIIAGPETIQIKKEILKGATRQN